MKRYALLLPVLLLPAACSKKLPEKEVLNIFARHSYESHSPEKISALLKEGGVKGLGRLDPHVALLKGKRPLKSRPSAGNVASGVLLGEDGSGFYLLKVFVDSPAWKAGFRDGDRLLAADGQPPSRELLAEKMSGGVPVKLRVSRGGRELEAVLPKNGFFFPQIFAFYDKPSRTVFVRAGLFFQGSAKLVLDALEAGAGLGAAKAVIDVRDNPGGVPGEAAEVVKAFAAKPGTVLELRSRPPGYSARYEAQSRGRFAGLRAAVLVNSGTSMAAETFAAAMREAAGAALVGDATAGSVSLTRAFRLSDGRGLEITVARLFPPSGAELEGAGVRPDIPAGRSGERYTWDNSRETALLGDEAWGKAASLSGGEAMPAATVNR